VSHGRSTGEDGPVLVGLVLVTLVLLAAFSSRWGLRGAAALAVVSVLWLVVNGTAEGPILWEVTPDHGLTATDLAGLAGLGVAAWRAWRGWQVWRSRSAAAADRTAAGRRR
jgi:uncharacterized membrane protein